MTNIQDIIAITMAAEEQYDAMCRFVECVPSQVNAQKGARVSAERWLNLIRECDLYLWTKEKSERCTKEARKHGNSILEIRKDLFPLITADPHSVVILMSAIREGTNLIVSFVVCSTMKSKFDDEGVREYFATGDGTMSFNLDKCDDDHWDGNILSFTGAFFCREGKRYLHLPDHNEENAAKNASTHLLTALQQVWYAHRPRMVVVRTETKGTRRAKRKGPVPGVVPRAHQKEVHIVLDPDEVRVLKQRSVSRGSHASPVPHKRRAHRRVLKAERYKKARGKVIDIGEIHVNCEPGEKIELPKKIYHVVSVGKIE